MQFNYTALDQHSSKVKGIIEAGDEKLAYLLLERQSLIPLNVVAINKSTDYRGDGAAPSIKQIMLFIEQLAILLTSGISLSIALNTLAKLPLIVD